MSRQIFIFSDGASGNKAGKDGGAGTVIIHGDDEYTIQTGWRNTTNNRMELRAALQGLEAITTPGYKIVLISDSQYVVNAFKDGWVYEWETNDIQNRKNHDLWEQMLIQVRRLKSVEFRWVKGHAGNHYNEMCDRLAGEARKWLEKPLDLNHAWYWHDPSDCYAVLSADERDLTQEDLLYICPYTGGDKSEAEAAHRKLQKVFK